MKTSSSLICGYLTLHAMHSQKTTQSGYDLGYKKQFFLINYLIFFKKFRKNCKTSIRIINIGNNELKLK